MALGDRIPTALISKELTVTAGDSTYANAGASYRTQVTKIVVTGQDGTSTGRTVTVYKGGTTSAYEKFNIDIDPTGTSGAKVVTIDCAIILTGTETIYAKQDVGTDCNIEVSGIVEQIA